MATQRLLCYFLITASVYQNALTKDVDCTKCKKEYNKFSSETEKHLKIQEEIRKIELKSQILPMLPFISQLTHNGDNLFFQPQIVMGSTVNGPFDYEGSHSETEDKENNYSILNEMVESGQKYSSSINTIEAKPFNPEPISTTEKVIPPRVIPEPPAYMPLNPPKFSSFHIESVKKTDKLFVPFLIPEPPAYIPLNPPKISSFHIENIKETGEQFAPVKNHPVVIPEPPAYIPLNPPKLPFNIVSSTTKCPPTVQEVFQIPKCPPSLSEKYKIFVCPTLELPQFREKLEIKEIHPHIPYFLPGVVGIDGHGNVHSVKKLSNTL